MGTSDTADAGDSLSSIADLDVIVDGDAHVTERMDDYLPYMDEDYDAIKRVLAEVDNPTNQVFSGVNVTPKISGSIVTDSEGEITPTYDSETKLEEMRQFDIDYGIVGPTFLNGINTINNPRYAVALAEAYNEWMLAELLADHEELKGALAVAPQKPEMAAEEIDDRGDEEDVVGVLLSPAGLLPPAGHERYDPIYDAAQRHDLPIVMHGTALAMAHYFPTQFQWTETYAENIVISHPFQQMWNMTTMLYRGVPEEFPDLDFVLQECGIGWVPYMLWRLDDMYLEHSNEVPYLDQLPSEYVREQFYFTTQPLGHTARDATHLAKAIEIAGPESIMYSSDLPHSTFDPPEELFDRINTQFDAETVRAIMGETALEVFDI